MSKPFPAQEGEFQPGQVAAVIDEFGWGTIAMAEEIIRLRAARPAVTDPVADRDTLAASLAEFIRGIDGPATLGSTYLAEQIVSSWLDDFARQVAGKALRDAAHDGYEIAKAIASALSPGRPNVAPNQSDVDSALAVSTWLRARAEQGGKGDE